MKLQASNLKLQGNSKSKTLNRRRTAFGTWFLKLLWSLLLGTWCFSVVAAKPALSGIQCYPPSVALTTAKSRQAIVVQATYSDGLTRDVSSQAGPCRRMLSLARQSGALSAG
jgi:hypothetical protein